MLPKMVTFCLAVVVSSLMVSSFAQDGQGTTPKQGPQPIYRVLIVSRSTKAVNYGHLAGSTKIDFKGTELLPRAQGEATVESRRGSVGINARFDHVEPPQRFGLQYLTYVLWAISPDGRAHNLGELVLDGSDKGELKASTEMQAFALIVTAEPYYSVSQPSNAVVMENAVRRKTKGKVEEVNATYELLPRAEFTYEVGREVPTGPAISMSQYEAVLALYQAQNAIQIAQSAGADRLAGERLARAQALFHEAQAQNFQKNSSKQVVAKAREAAQAAEDARTIALKRAELK